MESPFRLLLPAGAGRLTMSVGRGVVLAVGGWLISATAGIAETQVAFQQVAQRLGLSFRHVSPQSNVRHIHLTMGSGLGWIDYDRDGAADLYFAQGTPWTGELDPAAGPSDALYRQSRGQFEPVADPARFVNHAYGMGVAIGDLNADGFPDLFVSNFGPSRCFVNLGDGTFVESSQPLGLAATGYGASCIWFDADGDGLLDLFASNYVVIDPANYKTCSEPATAGGTLAIACPPWAYPGQPDRFYLNHGDGTFVDASEASGFHRVDPAQGLGVASGDLDGDGDEDLYVANDSVPNHQWMNDGHGVFTEVGLLAGTALNGAGAREAGMGIALGDGDGDGGIDLFVTNFQGETNTFYRHEFDEQFSDVTQSLGLGAPSRNRLGFGTNFLDAENDGDLDLFIANGHIHDRLRELGRDDDYEQRPQLMVFDRGRYTDASATAGAPFQQPTLGRGSATADFDHDGRIDVAVNSLDRPATLLRNLSEPAGPALLLRLIGKSGPRDAIGAQVEVRAGGRKLVRLREGSSSYLSCNDELVHVGLGTAAVESVDVRWPGGRRERFTGVVPDGVLLLIEGHGAALPAAGN